MNSQLSVGFVIAALTPGSWQLVAGGWWPLHSFVVGSNILQLADSQPPTTSYQSVTRSGNKQM